MVNYIGHFNDEEVQCEVIKEAKRIRVEILRKLCEVSPDLVDVQDSQGRIALHLVLHNNNDYAAGMFSLLLEFGANLRPRDYDGVILIHCAAQQGNVECFKLFVPPGRTTDFGIVDSHGRNPLHFAAMSFNEQAVRHIMEQSKSADLHAITDFQGQDALHISLNNEVSCFPGSYLRIVQILLAAGTRADRLNYQGRDALSHHLASDGLLLSTEIIQILL